MGGGEGALHHVPVWDHAQESVALRDGQVPEPAQSWISGVMCTIATVQGVDVYDCHMSPSRKAPFYVWGMARRLLSERA